MRNEIHPDGPVGIVATRDVVAGEYLLVSDYFGGVCAHAAASGANLTLHPTGYYTLTKADPADTFVVGAPVFGGDVDGVQSAPASDASAKIGVCVVASGGGATTVAVRLTDVTPA